MMTESIDDNLWLIVLLLLVGAAALFLIPALRTPRELSAADRDRLNTQLYYQRLRELEQDEAQGIVEGMWRCWPICSIIC